MKTEVSLSVADFQSDPQVKGALAVAPFSPKALLSKLVKAPPKTAYPNAFSSAEMIVSFTASTDAVRIDKLSASLDDTRITGWASLRRFAAPEVGFGLTVDRINVDRCLPPPKSDDLQAASASSAAAPGAVGNTSEAMTQTLGGNLQFQLKDGSIEGIDILGKICRAFQTVIRTRFEWDEACGIVLLSVKGKLTTSCLRPEDCGV